MSLPRIVLLSLLLSAPVLTTALRPATAQALEPDGILATTYAAILKCDVDIRTDLYARPATADTLASIQSTLGVIEGNAQATSGATATRLRGWASILREGLGAARAARDDDARRGALKVLLQDMAPMVSEARSATRSR